MYRPIQFSSTQLLDVKDNYCEHFKDVLMADPPPWFKSFCWCELLLQFPFFFVATYALWKGIYYL